MWQLLVAVVVAAKQLLAELVRPPMRLLAAVAAPLVLVLEVELVIELELELAQVVVEDWLEVMVRL